MNLTSIIALTEKMILSEECIDVVGIISVFISLGLTSMAVKSALKSATHSFHRHKVPSDITEEISIQSRMIHEGRDIWDTIPHTKQEKHKDTSKYEGSGGNTNKKFTSAEEAKKVVENNNYVRGFSYNEDTGTTYFHSEINRHHWRVVDSTTRRGNDWTLYSKKEI